MDPAMRLDYCKVMVAVLIMRGGSASYQPFIWLKNQGVAKQRLVCHGHPAVVGVHPLHLGCACAHQSTTHPTGSFSPSAGAANLAPAAFANGRLFEPLTLNISVSHRL